MESCHLVFTTFLHGMYCSGCVLVSSYGAWNSSTIGVMPDLSDDDLVAGYRAGPESSKGRAAIDELFHRHHTRVAAWCYKLTGNVDAASDLAQEVFFKAFQRLDTFRGDSKFTTWLYTITRNHCMDRLRSQAVTADHGAVELPDSLPDSGAGDVLEMLEKREAEELVRKLMRDSLDETETRVMTLHYVHELPLSAVTQILSLDNRSGAKAYIVSARRKLARAMTAWKTRDMRGIGNV